MPGSMTTAAAPDSNDHSHQTGDFPLDEVLALVRWQHSRRGYDNDAALVCTGLALLSTSDGDAHGLLERAEEALNVSWQRIVAEVMQFAVFLVTKARRDDEARPEQTTHGLRLLQLSLAAFANGQRDGGEAPVSLSTNSCNLLLSALAEVLETATSSSCSDGLRAIRDVKYVFVHLFGLPQASPDASDAVTPSFQLYRPPTNVFADFMDRALSASFKGVDALEATNISSERGTPNKRTDKTKELVALAGAVVCVYQELQKTQMNKRKVFLAVAKTSLRAILRFRHAMDKWANDYHLQGADTILNRLDQTVEDALFDAEHVREFDGALVHQRAVWTQSGADTDDNKRAGGKTKKRRGNDISSGKQSALISYQKQLFDELLSVLVDSQVSLELRASGIGEFLRVLMRGFSTRIRAAATSKIVDAKADPKTNRKRAAIVIAATSTTYSPFKFWAELCAVAFLAFQQLSEGEGSTSAHRGDAASILVVLYHSLFKSLREYDVYRVTEDTEEREQFTTMESVLKSFFERLPSDVSSVLDADSSIAAEHITDMRCQVVADAVECSPNLADCCCTPIMEMLGAQTQWHSSGSPIARLGAESRAVVDLIQAYDSMRLLETLLRAAFAVRSEDSSVARGLYTLLSQPACEARLRKAFVGLPPGQVDVLWIVFIDEVSAFSGVASSSESSETAKLAIVRLVFQMFMQELHVTPQNRTKVVSLVMKTLEAIVDPVAEAVVSAGAGADIDLSPYNREICSIFGELLMFYNAAKAASTTANELMSHVDAVVVKLGGSSDRFVSVIEALLGSHLHQQRKKSKTKKSKEPRQATTRDDGLSRAGIIKICVHWLQMPKPTDEGEQAIRAEHGERISKLVIDYVDQTHCWDAVAFYLPELVANATKSGAASLLQSLIHDCVAHAGRSDTVSAPQRILFDAAFYEIVGIRQVAAAALAACTQQYAASIRAVKRKDKSETIAGVASTLVAFFAFLVRIPDGYMPLSDCGDLLIQVLTLYKTLEHITIDGERRQALSGARGQVLTWLRVYFRPISLAVLETSTDTTRSSIKEGMRFMFHHDNFRKMDPRVVAEMLHVALTDTKDNSSFVGELLQSPDQASDHEVVARRATVVVQVIGLVHRNAPTLPESEAEKEAVSQALKLLLDVQDKKGDDLLDLDLLRALVAHQAAVSPATGQKRKHSDTDDEGRAGHQGSALFTHIGPALSSSMKRIATPSPLNKSSDATTAAWAFFGTCCAEYSLVRQAMVDELKGFGYLLAAGLSALGTWTLKHRTRLDKTSSSGFDKTATPLRELVRAANKQEFRLLIATIRKEVAAPELHRKLAALVALCDVVTGGGDDKKLSAGRRHCLSEFKEALLAALVQNSGELLLVLQTSADQETKQIAAEVAVWNVRLLSLWFCKPELFTWKSHELTQSLAAFETLYAAASPLGPSQSQLFSLDQLHRVWTYSYTLLLRIVRHHFASLVNCIPHLVQASNALLQVLVSTSSQSASIQPATVKLELSARWPLLVEWSSNLARLFGYMKEHDAQLRKHVVYLMMPFLVAATRGKLPVTLQQKLRPGVFALLDMCSLFEKEQLYAALDSSGKSLLKMLDTSYKLTYRYAGKV